MNLSLKFCSSLVNPVARAGEQGLGCHGGQGAPSSNSQRAQPVAAPSRVEGEGGVPKSSARLLAGRTEFHAHQGVPSPGKGSHHSSSPGRPLALLVTAGSGVGWRERYGRLRVRPQGGEQLCAFFLGRIGREWIPRVNMTRESLASSWPGSGQGLNRQQGRRKSIPSDTKAPSATTKERHGEHKVATVVGGRTPRAKRWGLGFGSRRVPGRTLLSLVVSWFEGVVGSWRLWCRSAPLPAMDRI